MNLGRKSLVARRAPSAGRGGSCSFKGRPCDRSFLLEFESPTGRRAWQRAFYVPKVLVNSIPARINLLDSYSRTQTTREGMAYANSPLGTNPTQSPATSASLVRTLAPCREMSMVVAASSVMASPAFNIRLMGIDASRRSHRRGVWGVWSCIGSPSFLNQTRERAYASPLKAVSSNAS